MCGSVAGVAWQFVRDMELLRAIPERVRESRCDKTGLCCVSSCCDVEAVCSAGREKLSCNALGVQSQIGGAGDFGYTAMCGTIAGVAVRSS